MYQNQVNFGTVHQLLNYYENIYVNRRAKRVRFSTVYAVFMGELRWVN